MFSIRNSSFASPLWLAPMAGFTDLPFRLCLRELGGLSLATTELVHARALLECCPKAMRLIATCAEDYPLAIQIFGDKPEELRDVAQFLETLGAKLIDINMGCPAPRVNRGGAGAALMKNPKLMEQLTRAVVDAVAIPVTVKMRLGWDTLNAPTIAPRLEDAGVAAITIHGRTRAQGHTGKVNLPGIRAVVEAVQHIPIIGNGDIRTPQDVQTMMNETGCAAVMIGRAILKDPFLFRRAEHFLRTGSEPPPAAPEEKIRFMRRYLQIAVQYLGEPAACLQFRKMISHFSRGFINRKSRIRHIRPLDSAEACERAIASLLADDKEVTLAET